MEKALNAQINAELYSAYLYLSMSAYFESVALKGMATWMSVQAQEEMVHAMKFYLYVIDRGGRVELEKLDAPKKEWESSLDAFQDAYKHEIMITSRINDLANLAIELKDHATSQLLLWYVKEQVEEESNADQIVQKLKLMQDAPGGLFLVDQELGARILLFTMPVTAMN